MSRIKENLQKAQKLILEAEYVYINAGAGMSADIGTPTYWTGTKHKYGNQTNNNTNLTALNHATEITWETHPAEQLEYFYKTFNEQTQLHKTKTTNHYTKLLEYLNKENKQYFVQTSNTDSAFYNYGYKENQLCEIHGSYRYSQCLKNPKEHSIYPTKINEYTLCPTCGSNSRPNALFFDDYKFITDKLNIQRNNKYIFEEKLQTNNSVIIEIGAGTTVPTIRNHTLRLNVRQDIPVIRLNKNTHENDLDGISALINPSTTAPILEFITNAQTGLKLLIGNKQKS
jgi:NAD-dependent SIR2 family protein deacetylase